MNAELKAKDLVDKMYDNMPLCADRSGRRMFAKQCALISVDEILQNDTIGMSSDFNQLICDTDYWQQVKEAINKL